MADADGRHGTAGTDGPPAAEESAADAPPTTAGSPRSDRGPDATGGADASRPTGGLLSGLAFLLAGLAAIWFPGVQGFTRQAERATWPLVDATVVESEVRREHAESPWRLRVVLEAEVDGRPVTVTDWPRQGSNRSVRRAAEGPYAVGSTVTMRRAPGDELRLVRPRSHQYGPFVFTAAGAVVALLGVSMMRSARRSGAIDRGARPSGAG